MSKEKEDIFTNNSEYALFVGKKFGYYARKWNILLKEKSNDDVEKLKKREMSHISFNVCAFFFTYFWDFYRKMYARGIFTLLGIIAASFVSPAFQVIAWIAFMIIYGMYGNKLYFLHVSKKIKNLHREIQNADILKSEIINTGGTSKIAVFITVIIISVLILVGIGMQEDFQHSTQSKSNTGVFDGVGKFLANETLNCDDESVISTVRELVNQRIAENVNTSIYIQSVENVAEQYYNPELKIRKCSVVGILNDNNFSLVKFLGASYSDEIIKKHGFDYDFEGRMLISFLIQGDMINLGDTWPSDDN